MPLGFEVRFRVATWNLNQSFATTILMMLLDPDHKPYPYLDLPPTPKNIGYINKGLGLRVRGIYIYIHIHKYIYIYICIYIFRNIEGPRKPYPE